ncbi:MAG: hypothetical protein J6I85_07060 [Clostridia bacterium]|nr:hypothetical protein [Clostridia bacterium]
MNKADFVEVQKHVNILNVAYHLSLEITEKQGAEVKAICPFCGYNKNSKIATLTLYADNNKFECSRCKKKGFSPDLYAKVKGISSQAAYNELLERECFSLNKSNIIISPINEIADIDTRNKVYSTFLNMLKLEPKHRRYLQTIGFLNSSIDKQNYKSIPQNYIVRRLIAGRLKKMFSLEGIPGFYQQADWGWTFTYAKGFFVPLLDEQNRIQALSVHLEEPLENTENLWFSSNGKINGTTVKNWTSKTNITENTKTIVITDNLIMNNLIKATTDASIIAYSNLNNTYQVLKELDNTNIDNIIFAVKDLEQNEKLKNVIKEIYNDLIPIGYNIETKNIENYKDILKDDFLCTYGLKIVA